MVDSIFFMTIPEDFTLDLSSNFLVKKSLLNRSEKLLYLALNWQHWIRLCSMDYSGESTNSIIVFLGCGGYEDVNPLCELYFI